MPKRGEKGASSGERRSGRVAALDWDSARVFLEVSRRKSFRAASAVLGESVNALRRRLARLERALDAKLVTRHVDGVRLTAEGERVLAAAKEMETASFGLVRAAAHEEAEAGVVRLAVTEGLGAYWIAPRLPDFYRQFPNVVVDLKSSMAAADVLRLEADVSIQIAPPQAKDLRRVKLARLHAMPFAAKTYLETSGTPRTVTDLTKHRIVLQVSDQVIGSPEFMRDFRDVPVERLVVFKSNGSVLHVAAIQSGVGIGMLPTYIATLGPGLAPVHIGYVVAQDIWMVYHPEVSRVARVRQLMEWLTEIFSPKKCPWFADAFVHPRDFPSRSERSK